MKKHLKDKKIDILGKTMKENKLGELIPVEGVVHKDIWAYYRMLSNKEAFYAGDKIQSISSVVFIINYKDNINTDMTIRFRNEEYEIIGIDDFEGYKGDLKIYAEKIRKAGE